MTQRFQLLAVTIVLQLTKIRSELSIETIDWFNRMDPITEDEQSQAQVDSSVKKFYAVSLAENVKEYVGEPLVFSSKLDALKAIKQYCDSRFKQFDTYEEAVEYASTPSSALACSSSGSSASFDENKTSYKSLSCQELVILRKQIETGNATNFYNLVWFNPRYLVNSNDSPTILQVGTHYNALHIAARYRQTDLCTAVLNTLSDLRFIELLYPEENNNPPVLKIKQERILDLYLNTPDKSLGESPLHFACKFGSSEIVKILLSYKLCVKDKPNKFDLRPVDMICDRISSSGELKCEIRSIFEDSSCIPVFRDVNNIEEPIFGEPCDTCSFYEEFIKQSHTTDSKSKMSKLSLCAFAGPMAKCNANLFYLAWKKKDFSELLHLGVDEGKELKEIRLSDPVKGLERIGRKLALFFNCQWIELWPALCHVWIDIGSDLGLRLLEKHLKCRTELICMFDSEQMSSSSMEQKSYVLAEFLEKGLVHSFCNIAKQIVDDNIKENLPQLFQLLMPETICITSYSFSNSEFLKYIHEEIAHLIYLKLQSTYSITDSVLHDFIIQVNAKLNLSHRSVLFESKNWKFLICIIKFLIFLHHSHKKTPIPAETFKTSCSCDWICESDYVFDSQSAYNKFVKIRQDLYNKMLLDDFLNDSPLLVEDEESAPEQSSFDEDEEFYTPPESPVAFDLSSEFSHRSPYIYINGFQMSDVDIDLYRCIEKLPINDVSHPHVFKWKKLMESELNIFLRPVTELNRTPASASATLKRHLAEKSGKARRLLF